MAELTKNQQRWQSIIDDWQQSGLSQSQYCRQHSINVNRFYAWKHLLKTRLMPASQEGRGVFLPVMMESVEPNTDPLLLIRVHGVEIEISHQTDPALLQKAVQWLGEAL